MSFGSTLLIHKTIGMRPQALGGKQGEQKGNQLETGQHLHLTLGQAEILFNPSVTTIKCFL